MLEEYYKLALEHVKGDGRRLQHIIHQTPEICLAAVKQSGDALQYVKEPTPDICMEAAKSIKSLSHY